MLTQNFALFFEMKITWNVHVTYEYGQGYFGFDLAKLIGKQCACVVHAWLFTDVYHMHRLAEKPIAQYACQALLYISSLFARRI